VEKFVFIGLAGGLGALSRYGLAGVVQRLAGTGFPMGTAVVNVLGCFLFGLIWTLIEERMILPPGVKPYVLTGFMGAVTTFSTYTFETGALLSASQWGLALANILGQTVLGLVFLFFGMLLGRIF
jgi:CrcB protein